MGQRSNGRPASRRGFTLIEIMITVAIAGVLALIAMPNLLTFQRRARTSEARSILGAVRTFQLGYFAEHGGFLCDASELGHHGVEISTRNYDTTLACVAGPDFLAQTKSKWSGSAGQNDIWRASRDTPLVHVQDGSL